MQPWPEAPAGVAAVKLRLLIVTDEMEVGGTQRQIRNLAMGLHAQGHVVSLVFFREHSHFVDELRAAGIRVVHLPKRGRVDPRFFRRLVHELKAGRYDVVHAFAFSAEVWTALARRWLCRDQRPPLVTSVRGSYAWYSGLQWRVKRWVSSQSTHVVANSRVAAGFATEHMRWDRPTLTVIYNGVAVEPVSRSRRDVLRAAWLRGESSAVALFVGRLVSVKDVATLIRAAASLRDTACALHVVICGDGPLREELQHLTEQLKIQDRLHFLGVRDDVADLIEASDMLVMPSQQEGLSNAILEAMRGARPVVATRAGGNVELVEPEQTGLMVNVGDVPGLAQAMRRLALDPALRDRMGRRAAERIQAQFSVSAMVDASLRIYLQAHHQPRYVGVAGR